VHHSFDKYLVLLRKTELLTKMSDSSATHFLGEAKGWNEFEGMQDSD